MRLDGSPTIDSLTDYVRVLRRRKTAFLLSLLLLAGLAVGVSLAQPERFAASAEVLISRPSLATSLTGASDPGAYLQAERIAQTQADLARVPVIARRVLRAVGLDGWTADDLLRRSTVRAKPGEDLLVFRVQVGDRRLAIQLANEYARQFSLYRRRLDTETLRRARAEVAARTRELKSAAAAAAAAASSTDVSVEAETERSLSAAAYERLYASQIAKEQQLRTLEALQRNNALVVHRADSAARVQPRPLRAALVGLAFGLLLGIGIAFLREAFDNRVRSAGEIADELGLPLLGRLNAPARQITKKNGLVMLAEPRSEDAEAYRMLRANLDFINAAHGARTIMITSAGRAEGKSTTAANLAFAFARSGKRVILVDLHVTRPHLHRIFALGARPGISDVANGYGRLSNALLPVADAVAAASAHNGNGNGNGSGNGLAASGGSDERRGGLAVVGAGQFEVVELEFVGSDKVVTILDQLRERCDLLLVDAPPLLEVGGALALAAQVDALIAVTRLNALRRPALAELGRVLRACPTKTLGFVVTEADVEDGYSFDARSVREPDETHVRALPR